MAIRDKMAQNAQSHLRPGENIQAVVGAQTASQYLILLAVVVFLIANRYRLIVATDQRIIVFDTGIWGMTKPKGVAYELPRGTVFGEGTGIWHRITAGPETLRVHRRFFKDLAASDAGASAGLGTPPPPSAPVPPDPA